MSKPVINHQGYVRPTVGVQRRFEKSVNKIWRKPQLISFVAMRNIEGRSDQWVNMPATKEIYYDYA
jgi:hypothetical protein